MIIAVILALAVESAGVCSVQMALDIRGLTYLLCFNKHGSHMDWKMRKLFPVGNFTQNTGKMRKF